jgi:osmotically-inducible protein OsmY
MDRSRWLLVVTVGLALAGAACDDTWKGVKKDTEENAEAAKKITEDEDGAAAKAGREVDSAAGKVKAKAEEVGQEIAAATEGAVIHVDVKQALILDDAIDAAHINVDVSDDTQTIVLKGTVPTLEQRSRAEEVARQRARGYTVRNELRVVGGK